MSDDQQGVSPSQRNESITGEGQEAAGVTGVELELAHERARSAKLARVVQELRFKVDILEKSYAKQLQDARKRCEVAEAARADLETRLAETDSAPGDAVKQLKELQARFDRLQAECDQLRMQPASAGNWSRDSWESIDADSALDPDALEGTINALLDDDNWLVRKAAGELPSSRDDEPSDEVEEVSGSDMLDPSLIFATGARKD